MEGFTPYTGHLWTTLLGYGEVGAIVEMVLGFGPVLAGILLLIEGWRKLYCAQREKRLAADGPYGVIRHPQYTGIMLAVFGQIIHWPTLITVALFPVIIVIHVWLAQREEAQMVREFGKLYLVYQRQVPMFFPRWGNWYRLLRVSSSSASPSMK